MAFPTLQVLDLAESQSPPRFTPPVKKINNGPDVTRFLSSKAYRDIGIFVLQLNRSVVPRKCPASPSGAQSFPLPTTPDDLPASIKALRALLDTIRSYIAEAPPDPGPRRFGNISFRTWHALLAERAPALLAGSMPDHILDHHPSTPPPPPRGSGSRLRDELEAYLLGAFGSSQRLDYGTGHELSFLAFLGCLWKLNFFSTAPSSSSAAAADPTVISRHIVLSVMEPYLATIRALITTYTLEPAGSHGVWGLDDHSFLPYIFGSAQLARPIAEEEATPLEGSVRGAPRTGDVVKAEVVEQWRASNMYFSAVGFINDVKRGPFWEHSPMLFDISGVKGGWGKINKGMIKMFNAEVLSKFPVIQHFPFGSLFSWDLDPDSISSSGQSVHVRNQPPASGIQAGGGSMQPWAQTTAMPPPSGQAATGIPTTRAPWAPAPGAIPRTGGAAPSMHSGKETGTGTDTAAQIAATKAPWARNG